VERAARKSGDLILVEGETDAISIWFHNIAALGLPGASLAKTLEAKYLDGIKRIFVYHVYVVRTFWTS
jgi:hypothetical protein